MKGNCNNCHGSGYICCPECDGTGQVEMTLAIIRLDKNMEFYAEVRALQLDAQRVTAQAKRLKALVPEHAADYEAQLQAALKILDAQVDHVLKPKTK